MLTVGADLAEEPIQPTRSAMSMGPPNATANRQPSDPTFKRHQG